MNVCEHFWSICYRDANGWFKFCHNCKERKYES